MRDKLYDALKKKEWSSYKDLMYIMSEKRYTAIARSIRSIKKTRHLDQRICHKVKQFKLR